MLVVSNANVKLRKFELPDRFMVTFWPLAVVTEDTGCAGSKCSITTTISIVPPDQLIRGSTVPWLDTDVTIPISTSDEGLVVTGRAPGICMVTRCAWCGRDGPSAHSVKTMS